MAIQPNRILENNFKAQLQKLNYKSPIVCNQIKQSQDWKQGVLQKMFV